MLISVQKKFNNCLCSATVFAIAMFFGVVIGVVSLDVPNVFTDFDFAGAQLDVFSGF